MFLFPFKKKRNTWKDFLKKKKRKTSCCLLLGNQNNQATACGYFFISFFFPLEMGAMKTVQCIALPWDVSYCKNKNKNKTTTKKTTTITTLFSVHDGLIEYFKTVQKARLFLDMPLWCRVPYLTHLFPSSQPSHNTTEACASCNKVYSYCLSSWSTQEELFPTYSSTYTVQELSVLLICKCCDVWFESVSSLI